MTPQEKMAHEVRKIVSSIMGHSEKPTEDRAAAFLEWMNLDDAGTGTEFAAACDCAAHIIKALQSEIRELKTPSGYWGVDGDPLCYDDGTTFSGSPVESFAELERWATQCLFDDGARIVARPYRAMPEETYIVRWVPDEDDADMRRVRLERVEE